MKNRACATIQSIFKTSIETGCGVGWSHGACTPSLSLSPTYQYIYYIQAEETFEGEGLDKKNIKNRKALHSHLLTQIRSSWDLVYLIVMLYLYSKVKRSIM